MEGLNFERLTQNYLNHCKYEKGLDEKTMKAYNIDLAQYASTSSDPNDLFTKNIFNCILPSCIQNTPLKA